MPHVTFIHGIANKPAHERLLTIWRQSLAMDDGLDLGARPRLLGLDVVGHVAVEIELEAQHARLDGQTSALRRALQVTAAEAAAILDLQQDVLFAELVTAWAESSAELTRNLARCGRKHQQVVSAEETERELRLAMVKRARKPG